MSVLKILTWPDVSLCRVCAAVDDPADHAGFARDLLDTMYAAQGRGLAAPQVGATDRIFVMDASWKTGDFSPRVLINPEILHRSSHTAFGTEACLSIPGIEAEVQRHAEIHLRWWNEMGEAKEETLSGFEAVCVQHEMDHLDGLVIFDRVSSSRRDGLMAVYAEGERS